MYNYLNQTISVVEIELNMRLKKIIASGISDWFNFDMVLTSLFALVLINFTKFIFL